MVYDMPSTYFSKLESVETDGLSASSERDKSRLYSESPNAYKTEFEKDYERIIRSNSFRRLQYKTQVVVNHEGDHFRNRLTHSIEVANVARLIAKQLNLSEELAQNISLCHDIGHAPFGHTGEDVLREEMKDYGGFCHNAHAIHLLTKIDSLYPRFVGLNLTWGLLEGIAKHNGPLLQNVPSVIADYNSFHNLDLHTYPSLEAQVSSLSDDITYNCHDIEDGVRMKLFNIEDLEGVPILAPLVKEICDTYKDSTESILVMEVTRKLRYILIEDLLSTTKTNLQKHSIKTAFDVRQHNSFLASFSANMIQDLNEIKSFLYNNFYNNHQIYVIKYKCKKIVKKLFKVYMDDVKCMPVEWQKKINDNTDRTKATIVSDYIACMTDRYAIKQFELLHNLRFANI